jgi:hypothetical protein
MAAPPVADILARHGSQVTDLKDILPDARDGLTRKERIVLYVLHRTQLERRGRNVPTTMLWGRVCEHFRISPEEPSAMLARLGANQSFSENGVKFVSLS